ncbi:DNA-directed RNA polymerase subunit alpha [Ureaplasma canigenitalium]|uniref:DNA-directed RNA polymerase subunit alpha n=1 Tax=Ureaplasma canigenitalium TaxID=42092 RepID=UPI000690F47C|nr:DNA-directed RNA polymerase subunit alpha [Ureaplasma canigenitalium]
MQKFLKYNIDVPTIFSDNPNRTKIKIGPLETGFGDTLGNALRRICLSSIQGASMFAVKFVGHSHEFQAIPGVKEDLTHIILNLKSLAIKVNEQIFDDEHFNNLIMEKWPKMMIKFEGPGLVTAGDIICPLGFEILNKELIIAEVTEPVSLEIEIYARTGRGRVDFMTNKDYVQTLHMIPTDSNYSPVIHFKYDVETIKDSKNSVSEILTIDIATNGTVSGSDAIAIAAKIMQAHLQPIVDINKTINNLIITREKEEEEKRTSSSIMIDDLDLTVRAYNALKQSGINSTLELIEMNRATLERIKNLGRKSVTEIVKKLADRGLYLKDDHPTYNDFIRDLNNDDEE